MSLKPGQFRFTSVRNVGVGGLGIVDEIEITEEHQSTKTIGQRLARKRLNAQWKEHPTARERFEREIDTIRRLRHPSIVSFEGENVGGASERFYVMPLYPTTLRHSLNTQPKGFSLSATAAFGARLAGALAHAHADGFIHRDLKPENVLLDGLNNPVICDWGLGYFIHKHSKVFDLTVGGMGTEYYCSEEQWETGKCNEAGDVYSLGIMLAELYRGALRPRISQGAGLADSADIVRVKGPGADAFNDLLRRMTTKRASDRMQSMAEVRSTLLAITAESRKI